ncbi:unnamed protein product [Schistosoma margrebowiei]|uniref:Phosphoserine phosphatase n=1 Tax=Schistosoma margrebowiei TaxID=48269 RepID=A0A183L8L7_9TREM|nr:unnamed protein product [Schistosoma margrebowiei]
MPGYTSLATTIQHRPYAYRHIGTEEAMNGELDITKALEARLSIMNLNLKKLTDFLDNHPVRLTPGVENLVNQFKENGVDVYLVSGGLYPLVNRVAKLLNIPEENVYANKLIFDNEGSTDC